MNLKKTLSWKVRYIEKSSLKHKVLAMKDGRFICEFILFKE